MGDTVFGVSPRVKKFLIKWGAVLHVRNRVMPFRRLNMGVMCKQYVSRIICMSRKQELFLLSPRNISVYLAFIARYKVSEVAKLGDTRSLFSQIFIRLTLIKLHTKFRSHEYTLG